VFTQTALKIYLCNGEVLCFLWGVDRILECYFDEFGSAFFTTECLASCATYHYEKDERALPGDLHSRKLSFVVPLLNVVSSLSFSALQG
jgi:hypothetical protein